LRNSKLLIAVAAALSVLIVGVYVLYAVSNYFSATAAIKIELVEKCQDFKIGLPQVEQLYLKNLANRPWQIEISAFDIWGSGSLDPSSATLKWNLENVSQSFETVELYSHEGLIGYRNYQKIDLPAGYDGVLAFELTFTNAPKGNYSRLLSIDIYDPQGEADVWEWQNTTTFAIT
jgi:hypothetical protein